METTQIEWRDDLSFPFKHHLYGWVEAPGDEPRERLLASYWLARDKWDWHVHALGRVAYQAGTSASEKEARKEIIRRLGIRPGASGSKR